MTDLHARSILAALSEVMDAAPVLLDRVDGFWELRLDGSGAVLDRDPNLAALLRRALGRLADAEALGLRARLTSDSREGAPGDGPEPCSG